LNNKNNYHVQPYGSYTINNDTYFNINTSCDTTIEIAFIFFDILDYILLNYIPDAYPIIFFRSRYDITQLPKISDIINSDTNDLN